jgi:hypothetical protein
MKEQNLDELLPSFNLIAKSNVNETYTLNEYFATF